MKLWVLIGTLTVSLGHIPLGSMDGYLTTSEVSTIIANLTSFYSGIMSVGNSNSNFNTLILTNSSAYSGYYKQTILILGGLYGGYPMGTFEVLEIAEVLASAYLNGDPLISSIIKTCQLHFIPIPNYAAYLYSQKNYNQTNFPVVETGLEGNASKCAGKYDVGINPNHNFAYTQGVYSNNCSNNYQGSSAFTSNVSNSLSNYLKTYKPVLLLNYQGTGNTYYIPYASSSQSIPNFQNNYYGSVNSSVPVGYTYASYSDSNPQEYGTLLDYAFNQSIFSFQIAITNLNRSTIYGNADWNINFVLEAIQNLYPSITVDPIKIQETVCKDNCTYYSSVVFEIYVTNSNAYQYNYSLDFSSGFSSDYTLASVVANVTLTPGTAFRTLKTPSASPYTFVDYIEGYSSYALYLTFYRLYQNSSTSYNAQAALKSVPGGYYLDQLNFALTGNLLNSSQSSGNNDSNYGVIVGLVLLIILLILVSVAAIVLYCTRKTHEQFENNNPRAPTPQISRI
jgi:Zinc carboxypeptidase